MAKSSSKSKCNSCTFPADRQINTITVQTNGPFKWPNVFHMKKNKAPIIILKLLSFLRDILGEGLFQFGSVPNSIPAGRGSLNESSNERYFAHLELPG